MFLLELHVNHVEYKENYDSLGAEKTLNFRGKVFTSEQRFKEIKTFELALQVKNNNIEVLGEGELFFAQKSIKATAFLSLMDIQMLISFLPSFASKALNLSFELMLDNAHEVLLGGRKTLQEADHFYLRQLIQHIGFSIKESD